MIFTWFFIKRTSFAINSRNHYQSRHPDPCRILVGTLNPWNGHPRVLPWPILFGRVAKKSPVNHHYSWVCILRWVPKELQLLLQNVSTGLAYRRLRNSDSWRVFYGWRALRQPCRESRQPCFMVDGVFGQMVDGAMFKFKIWTFWPSIWYHIDFFHTNFSIRVYLA